MKWKLFLLLFFLSLSLLYPINYLFSNVYNPSSDYQFLWNTLSDPPGFIEGDDSIIWGSDLGPYYNYSELTSKLLSLNSSFPNIVDLFSIGKSCLGKELWMVRITEENSHTNKHGIFLVAQTHGREVITVMNALFIIDKLIYEYVTSNPNPPSLTTKTP
ncbi:MAG: M14 family zinc carboxypeptidase, partial [Candidatus Thorarchaeota archaeon]